MKTLIVYKSIHQGNTRKLAEEMGKILNADVMEPHELDISNIDDYDMIGFGSGIYDGGFHKAIVNLLDKMPDLDGKRVFIFSTAGVVYDKSHRDIKEKLLSKNAVLVDEFYCKGFNKNSFLKYFGGMNKGRPNAEDLEKARKFAARMIQ